MGLYKLFSYNVEIQYKSCFLSKAMVFTLFTVALNIILPFIIAYRSRGFWLKTDSFYEQPEVRLTFEYLLVAETNDPSHPIVCGEIVGHENNGEENCVQIQVKEHDYNDDGKHDALEVQFFLTIPMDRTISSVIVILGLDFQIQNVCPLQMQSLAVIEKSFPMAPSGFLYNGDVELYQIAHLPCISNILDTKFNNSLFNIKSSNPNLNIVDYILEMYFNRQVITHVKTLHSRSLNGHTGAMDLKIYLRIPEMKVVYLPSLLQELKWAWPQYLSLVVIFYWILNRIKMFVFNNRLLMAWEVVPWKMKHSFTKVN